MQHHAPKIKFCFQKKQSDMKINIAYYKYLWKEKVIFQTTKLGTCCLSFQRRKSWRPFSQSFIILVISGTPDFENRFLFRKFAYINHESTTISKSFR